MYKTATPAFLTLLASLLITSAILADVRTFRIVSDDKQNVVQFVSEATLERIVGRTHDIRGSLELDPSDLASATKGSFKVDLRTIDTGIGLRNQHMRDNHLHTSKYPEATFVLTQFVNVSRADLAPGETVSAQAEGEFTIHGVTKAYQIPVTLTYVPGGDEGNIIKVTGDWSLKLADHNINRPEFLFMRLAEEQKISVVFALTDAAGSQKE